MAKKSTAQSQTQQTETVPVATQVAAPAQQTAPAEKKARVAKKATETATPATTQVATPATTQVAAPAQQESAPAPVEKKARSSKKATETATPATTQVAAPATTQSTPAPATTQVSAPVEQQLSSSSEQSSTSEESVESLFQTLISQAESLVETQKGFASTLRKAVKFYNKESRENARTHARLAAKKSRKVRDETQKRAPSGFQIPTQISNELCTFLGVPLNTKMSRNVVTKQINSYIQAQNLQVQGNRRSFVPDAKLGAILGPLKEVDAEKGFNYFNLQRYISRHFVSSASASQQSATVSASS
jgi:chromatin remodeling complex protein RSC6